MKGLFIKDLALIRNQKKSFLVIFILGVAFSMMNEGSFAIGYMCLLCSMLSLGTISFDEYDHGYAFLFTLPFTRKQYVSEKYLFCFTLSIIGLLVGILFSLIAGTFSSIAMDEVLVSSFSMLVACAILLGFMIPMRIKYGSDGGKVGIGIIFGILIAGFILLDEFLPDLSEKIVETLDRILTGATPLILMSVFSITAIIVSMIISRRIIANKEF